MSSLIVPEIAFGAYTLLHVLKTLMHTMQSIVEAKNLNGEG